MGSTYQWIPRKRNYKLEKKQLISSEALLHPLRPASAYLTSDGWSKANKKGFHSSKEKVENATENSNSTDPLQKKNEISKKGELINHKKQPEFVDPLGVTLDDPLSQLENEENIQWGSLNSKHHGVTNNTGSLENSLAATGSPTHEHHLLSVFMGQADLLQQGFETWDIKRTLILQHYTTSEKLSIVTSFLPGGVPLESHVAVANRTKHRLEQLDEFEDRNSLKRMANLSQQDYINRINELGAAMREAWRKDERVQSVKIVIQSAKLLGDVSVAQFYPSQFVLVTDILETFGSLVFSRLWTKANQELEKSGLTLLGEGGHFHHKNVPETTKETARNWFYKIASIRELLPRFYVETALLRCQKFLVDDPEFFCNELNRLALMIRGIGNPMVAAYARCYLCRVGIVLAVDGKAHIWTCLNDWFSAWSYYIPLLNNISKGDEVGMGKLFWPALQWIAQCLAFRASDDEFMPVLEYCKQRDLQPLILNPILTALPPKYVASEALDLAKILLKTWETLPACTATLLRSFGLSLLKAEPSPDIKRPLLREMWKAIMKFNKVDDYMTAAEVWLEFACRHFGPREVNTLIDDMIRHLAPDKAYQDYYPKLLSILDKIVTNMRNFQTIFSMDRFIAFLDLLQKDHVKVQACHSLLEAFGRYQVGWSEDLSLSNHVMTLCKSLHDSLNAMSLEDERRNTVSLICRSLDKFRFSTDSEQELSFLVESRANFSNLDDVIEYVVHRCNLLAAYTRQRMEGRLSRKTAYFVRACVAYSYITIPSIVSQPLRLKLYTESASVALVNNCLPQADALLKAAISLIPELPFLTNTKGKTNEGEIVDGILELLSLLLVVPDPPEHNQPLYLFTGLLTAIKRYPWPEQCDAKVRIFLACLSWLSTAEQTDYPYHVDAVESNDTLYGGSEQFRSAVRKLANDILEGILGHLKHLAGNGEYGRQSTVTLNFLECLLLHGDMEEEGMRILAGNLWNLAKKYGQMDKQKLLSIGMFVRGRAVENQKNHATHQAHNPSYKDPWADLCIRMKL